jgi:hypothetical protein
MICVTVSRPALALPKFVALPGALGPRASPGTDE